MLRSTLEGGERVDIEAHMGTQEQRTAGTALIVLGGLNALLGLLGLFGGTLLTTFALLTLIGVAIVVLGVLMRRGSRSATLVSLVVLGLLLVNQLVLLVVSPDATTVLRIAITALLAYLTYRAYQTA